jgi:hypothetical protein
MVFEEQEKNVLAGMPQHYLYITRIDVVRTAYCALCPAYLCALNAVFPDEDKMRPDGRIFFI